MRTLQRALSTYVLSLIHEFSNSWLLFYPPSPVTSSPWIGAISFCFGLSSRLKATSCPATSNRRRAHKFMNLPNSKLLSYFPLQWESWNSEFINSRLRHCLPACPLAAPVPETLGLNQWIAKFINSRVWLNRSMPGCHMRPLTARHDFMNDGISKFINSRSSHLSACRGYDPHSLRENFVSHDHMNSWIHGLLNLAVGRSSAKRRSSDYCHDRAIPTFLILWIPKFLLFSIAKFLNH
jgi:hypothetical protein